MDEDDSGLAPDALALRKAGFWVVDGYRAVQRSGLLVLWERADGTRAVMLDGKLTGYITSEPTAG